MQWALVTACRELPHFTIDQVMQMTPFEYYTRLEGVRDNESDRLRMEAVWVAHLMNATGNFAETPITADLLLGKEESKTPDKVEDLKLRERAERRRQERLAERAKREQRDGDSG